MFSRGSSTHKSSSGLPVSGSNSSPSTVRPHPLSLCADCGAQGPSWASINRGVLLCSDCTSVHRSLGRHLSHVKSLRGGSQWIPEQLTMVQSLYSCGANSIWEYSLLNPSSSKGGVRKKPSASDPLHPVKSDFITAKYQQLAFVYKPGKDEPAISQSDLSKQLHSSVRTPNLETSLRLISQGADPNYYHPEKNSTPLQVAARAGQSGQIELLLVYGADPGAVDKMGRTASDYAKQAGNSGLANRILNSQFELSDRLTFFLCQKRPDHANNFHFIIPEMEVDPNVDEGPKKVAKRKMQGLNNSVFEEMAMDVFDEVDRRETDLNWASLEKSSKSVIIPFLPVNPEYGTTRNQGRQKLARLSTTEFAVLVLDVLKEIKRRQTEMNSKWPKMPSPLRETATNSLRGPEKVIQTKSLPVQRIALSTTLSDEEPIYDHVASDDDYYHIPEKQAQNNDPSRHDSVNSRSHDAMAIGGSSVNSSPAKSNASSLFNHAISASEYRELRSQLENSEVKVQKLMESNDDMKNEIARLSVTVSKLVNENEQLKYSISPVHTLSNSVKPSNSVNNHNATSGSASNLTSMSSPLKTTSTRVLNSGPNSMPALDGSGPSYMTLPNRCLPGRVNAGQQQASHSHYYEQPYNHNMNDNVSSGNLPYTLPHQNITATSNEGAVGANMSHSGFVEVLNSPASSDQSLPSQEEVVRRTEAITRCIQELLISAKDEEFAAFIPCSERIVRAVTDMVVLFPEEPTDTSVSASLSSLTAAATHFETECRILIVRSQTEPLNQSFVTQQVIQCAFDIAKATKQLVALFQ